MIAQASRFETEKTQPVERDGLKTQAAANALEVGRDGARPSEREERQTFAETNGEPADEFIYLLGRPTLDKFPRFMIHQAVNGRSMDEGALTDEWRAAYGHIQTLAKEEAGIADRPPISKLDPRLDSLCAELLKAPLIVHGFNKVPANFAMVELDRLVVYQRHIDLAHVRRLKDKIGPAPTEEEIFRICLPCDPPQPPMKWARAQQNTYVFLSPSNDLRFLGVMPLQASQVTNYPPPGSLAGVVGIAVGFGSNFLNVVDAENRLVLHNGSHRAVALRELGVTHAPCLIQFVSSLDELQVVASGDLRERPDYYLRHPRPSMLKDYLDPKLRKILAVHRRLRQVTVKFEVNETYVPAM